VESGIDPGRRFVIADPLHPIHNLDLRSDAPMGHKRLPRACVLDGVESQPSARQLASSHVMI
jgi:hypothetical protein